MLAFDAGNQASQLEPVVLFEDAEEVANVANVLQGRVRGSRDERDESEVSELDASVRASLGLANVARLRRTNDRRPISLRLSIVSDRRHHHQ